MMNVVQLQERLKDFSKNQLVSEMKRPSGNVPQYLVLSELQRRKRMEATNMAQQGAADTTTVAEDAVAAAGVPQGGLAGMARAMAPKTDMARDTGQGQMPQAPVQAMAEGGDVAAGRSTVVGGRAYTMMPDGIVLNARTGEGVDEFTADAVRQRLNPEFERGDVFDPAQPVLRQVGIGEFTLDPARPMQAIAERELSDLGVNPSYETDMRDREYGIGISDRSMQSPSEDEAPRRMLLDATLPQSVPPLVVPEPDPYEVAAGPIFNLGKDRAPAPGNSGPLPEEDDYSGEAVDMGIPNRWAEYYADRPTERDFVAQGGLVDWNPDALPVLQDYAAGLAGETFAEQAERLADRDARRAERLARPTLTPPSLDTLPEAIQSAEDAAALRDEAGITESLRTPEEVKAAGEAAKDTVAKGTDTAAATPGTASGAGKAGGTGGMTDLEKSLEQDKWLALAQFGLGLMQSDAPTMGKAIGEAGLGAIASLKKAKQDFEDAKLARATLAARMAGGASSGRPKPPPASVITMLNDRLSEIDAALGTLEPRTEGWFGVSDPDADKRMRLMAERAATSANLNAAMGAYGLGGMSAVGGNTLIDTTGG